MNSTWEMGLLGSLIADQDAWGEMVHVQPSDFYSQQNRVIFIHAAHLAKNQGLSATTLIHTLEQTGELVSIGDSQFKGADYINHLVSLGDPLTASEFVKHVLDESDLRRLSEVGALLIAETRAGNKTAQEILQDTIQSIIKIQRSTREPRLIGSLNPDYLDRAHKILSGEAVPFWEPPIDALRNVLPHLEDVDFMLVAGQPGTGKSSLVRELGLLTALRGQAVLALPFEQSETEYHSWAVSRMSAVDHFHVMDPRRQKADEADRVAKAIVELQDLPYYIYSMGIADIQQVVATVKSFVVKHPETQLIIVDGIYLIGGKGEVYENISNNTQTLRSLAQELHVPVIGTTQFKRLQKDGSGKKKGALDQLLYAGENAARVVLSLVKAEIGSFEALYFPENRDEHGKLLLADNYRTIVVQAEILKNTNGRTGMSGEMAWRKPYGAFDSLAADWRTRSRPATSGSGNGYSAEPEEEDDAEPLAQPLHSETVRSFPKPSRESRKPKGRQLGLYDN